MLKFHISVVFGWPYSINCLFPVVSDYELTNLDTKYLTSQAPFPKSHLTPITAQKNIPIYVVRNFPFRLFCR